MPIMKPIVAAAVVPVVKPHIAARGLDTPRKFVDVVSYFLNQAGECRRPELRNIDFHHVENALNRRPAGDLNQLTSANLHNLCCAKPHFAKPCRTVR